MSLFEVPFKKLTNSQLDYIFGLGEELHLEGEELLEKANEVNNSEYNAIDEMSLEEASCLIQTLRDLREE